MKDEMTGDASRRQALFEFLRYIAAFALLSCCLFGLMLSCMIPAPYQKGPDVEGEAQLQPVIQYVETFIKEHGRLPTQREFHTKAEEEKWWMVELHQGESGFAQAEGAKKETDYIAGIWRGEWSLYYKSWDRSFFEGSVAAIEE